MPNRPSRRLKLAAALLLPAAGLFAADPALAREFGLDVWSLPGLEREVAAEDEVARGLDDEAAHTRSRIVLKEALVGDLIAGRTTLRDVTARFAEIDAEHPEYLAVIRDAQAGSTDEEKFARNVIAYALQRVPDRADRDQLADRLEDELHQLTAE